MKGIKERQMTGRGRKGEGMTYCREGRDLKKDNEGEAHNNEGRGGERGMKDRGLRCKVSERGSI